MHITILQLDEIKDKRRVKRGLPSLLYQPYNPNDFSLKNYKIIHINFKFQSIDEKYFESILSQIKKDFKSFYTCEERPENGIVVGDVVKIGQNVFYYNGEEEGWKYIGRAKPCRW